MKEKFVRFYLVALAALLCCAGSGALAANKQAAMSRQAYLAAKTAISTQYKADRKYCAGLNGHSRDVCRAQAQGKADAARADLEARYRPSPDAVLKARNVTADANYEVARTKCEVRKRPARSRCIKEAKGSREAAVRQAKVEKNQATGGPFHTGPGAKSGKGADS
jgi:hypothetical protein